MTPHPYPNARTLHRAQPWQSLPARPLDVRRAIAVHEGGHIVLMRWVGLQPPAATIHVDAAIASGEAHWPAREFFAALPEPDPDETGVLSSTAASVFHAGIIAEQIEVGAPWAGPIHYPHASDYQRAEEMLRPRFGCHASGAHAYAQLVARHVLESRWPEVDLIATELVRAGRWSNSSLSTLSTVCRGKPQ